MPLTRNQADGAKWYGRHRQAKLWRTEVHVAMGRRAQPPEKARVTITVYRARRQDPDNAVASVKPVLDAMVKTGWLKDDRHECLELHVEEIPGTKKPDRRTMIEWERVVE